MWRFETAYNSPCREPVFIAAQRRLCGDFSDNCVKNSWRTYSTPTNFFLVIEKIASQLRSFRAMNTGSDISQPSPNKVFKRLLLFSQPVLLRFSVGSPTCAEIVERDMSWNVISWTIIRYHIYLWNVNSFLKIFILNLIIRLKPIKQYYKFCSKSQISKNTAVSQAEYFIK